MNVFKQLYSKLLWSKTGFEMAFFLHENAAAPTKNVEKCWTKSSGLLLEVRM
jgi:hypothetical protein